MTKLTPNPMQSASRDMARRVAFHGVPAGSLPDAPLSMPTQTLEQPSRFGQLIRALLALPLGRAET
jgi:hypothetical protein